MGYGRYQQDLSDNLSGTVKGTGCYYHGSHKYSIDH